MDIRQAKPPVGTMPPRNVAPEPQPAPSANVDENGEIQIDDLDSFGGDIVIKGYMDYLAKNGLGENDVTEAMEALLTSGSVSWSFDLFDRIPVNFIVRPAWVDNYISEILDAISAESALVSNVRYNNIVAECNLSASLTKYGEKEFVLRTNEDLENTRAFVRNLPYIVQNALVRKLAVFDRLLAVATSDWAIKNFMTPRKEK